MAAFGVSAVADVSGAVPAGAYNVAAQLVALEPGIDLHPPWARVHLREGVWATLRADRLDSSSNLGPVAFAVTIEPTPAADRASLFARVIGLTERESELLLHLERGSDTRTLAHGLFMSEQPCRTTSSRSSPRPDRTVAGTSSLAPPE